MRKKSLLCALVFSSCVLCSLWCSRGWAQDETANEGERRPAFDFTLNLSVGLSSYEDSAGEQAVYQKYGVFPEFSYGRWGLGFDLSLELDGDFHLMDLDNDGHPDRWTTLHDYITRIHYVRYGKKGDPLYGRIGAFDSRTLGHGLVMERYSNTVFYPQVIQLGFDFNMDGELFSFPYVGFEAVADDVLDWDIVGVRLYARPLAGSAKPLLKRLEFGGTFVTDQDPQENPLDVPEDDSASEGVSEYGVDVELPLLEKDRTSLLAYADWAKIVDGGSGALLGSTLTYGWLALLGQLRFNGEGFAHAYFDSFYERDRGGKSASLAAYGEFYVGYLIGTEMSVLDTVTFSFRLTDGIGGPEMPRVIAAVDTGEKFSRKLGIAVSYDMRNIESFSDLFSEDDSLIRLTLGYKLGAAADIVFTFERAYSPYSLDPADRIYIDTRFSF
jgi:hypothetical protein